MIDGAKTRVLEAQGLRFTAYEMGLGPLVMCLHGFPDTPATFKRTAPALAQAGFRAVAVTLRGYEQSSLPGDNDFSLAALAEDVRSWIRALGAEEAYLIGHDWGASVAYAAAALAPEQIKKLVTLAVPHPAAFAAAMVSDYEQIRRSWYIYLFQLRGTAELILQANDFAVLKRLWRDWSPPWDDSAALAAMESALVQPGVLSAALDYYRTAFDINHPRTAQSQALLSSPLLAPTLGICGAEDGCVSADIFEAAMPSALFSGGVRTMRVANAGHFVHLEQSEIVNRAILAHLA